MSDSTNLLASKLAEDVLAVQDRTGEDRLFIELGNVLAASSQTLEEAFLTEVRLRLAERAARKFLDQRTAALDAKTDD